ncbi:MAG: DNA polymerase III [Treponemataceae bacterium]
MFDNILHQNVITLLKDDIKKNHLPQSLLFTGKIYSGKLTSALELARVLSCEAIDIPARWECQCPSCKQHKLLQHQNVLILGGRDCCLEIEASSNTFLKALEENATYVTATLYLFIRSVRKLTCRFNTIVLEGDDKASKIANLLSDINELLEELDSFLSSSTKKIEFSAKIEKKIKSIISLCQKLETGFLTGNFPINHIRKITTWCHLTSTTSKKIIIFENADKMHEASRNALLKILEEPPSDTIFILLSANKSAIMSTILSRVRTYSFFDRSFDEQKDVLSRVFHIEETLKASSLESFFTSFLPVSPEEINAQVQNLLQAIYIQPQNYDASLLYAALNKFDQKIILKYFLQELLTAAKKLMYRDMPLSTKQRIYKINQHINLLFEQITVFNQNPLCALELFIYNLQQNQQGFA